MKTAFLLLMLGTAKAYTDDPGLAPFWERVDGDPSCTHASDCGYPGITSDACAARGCCFDPAPGTQNWCSGVATKCKSRADCNGHGDCDPAVGLCSCDAGFTGWNCSDTVITKVHVVMSCHLDVGFTDLSAGVINRYLSHHIPTAIATAQALRNDSSIPSSWRLKFMAQSYYIGFYLDCPPNMGFACPTVEQQDALREAIRMGDITWHAFPHNAELENTSPVMLDEGLRATKRLDAAFGLPTKRSLSQRDVPGVPRSVIPVLRDANVSLVSVGVNGASMYPRVPNIFRWVDPVSGQDVLAMWHPRGYGGYSAGEAVTIKGWNEALVTDWIGDNAGPGDAAHYKAVFAQVQKEFPNATVVGSTFDEWLDAVEGSGHRDTIPVVTEEVGDSWIYGVPSDPKKTAQARALDRAITRYLVQGGERDAAYNNFTRLAIKNCEHTWGRDVKSNLKDNVSWNNTQFEAARTTGPNKAEYNALESSWWEQRQWGFDFALQALPATHPLAQLAEDEIEDINQPVPYNGVDDDTLRAAGFAPLSDPSVPTECGAISIGFSRTTGAITHLTDGTTGVSWASKTRPLLALQYRSYSAEDFTIFQNQYANLSSPPDWFRRDFGKPGETISAHSIWHGQLKRAWSRASANETTFLLISSIVDDAGDATMAHYQYGAPEAFVTQVTVSHEDVAVSHQTFTTSAAAPRLSATVWCVNKSSTRLPETMFVSFTPDNTSATLAKWEMQKLGQWQRTDDVVAGGSQHLHGVSIGSGVRFNKTVNGKQNTISIEAVDAPVINLGAPLGFPVPCEKMDDPWAYKPDVDTYGVSSVLWNNLWGTNYVQWYPFNRDYAKVAGEENFISRYNLRF